MTNLLKPIGDRLHPQLRELSFRRRGNTWNRTVGLFTDIVDLQLTKSLDHVWVNVAVADPSVHELVWGSAPSDFLQEPFGTVRSRLGPLYSEIDEWWDIQDPSTPDRIWTKLAEYGIPFLEAMHSPSAMADQLSSRPGLLPTEKMILAALLVRADRRLEACEELTRLQLRPLGDWKARVDEMRVEFGCG